MKIKYLLVITILLFSLTGCQEALLDGTESSVSENGDIKKIQITAQDANIRSGCSADAGVIQNANVDETFDVINEVADWYAVKLPDNSIGFVPRQQCKPIVDETIPIDLPSVAQRTPVQVNTSKKATQMSSKPQNNNTSNNGTATNNGDNNNGTANNNGNADKVASSSSLSAAEQQMVDLVNKARAENNLPALKVDIALANVARTKSQDMIDNSYFSHNSPTYGSPFDMMKSFSIRYIKAGENIAGNQTVQAAHDALMKSPGHRANILNSDYTHIGIGIVEGGSYGNMFTQMFISK